MTEHKKRINPKGLLEAAGIVSLMTLFSRILGMIRDVVSAKQFGTSWQWDAFVYAFMLPNFFRRIVGEGALSSAFIPVYSETLAQKGKVESFRLASVLATLLGVCLAGFILVLEGVLSLLLHHVPMPERLMLTLDLLRYLFPYLWFISLYALSMGILHCHRHFLLPSLGPVILDIFWIAGILWVTPFAGPMPQEQLRFLCWVILVSGAVQFGVQLPYLWGLGFRYRFLWEWMDAGVKKTVHLLTPSVMSFAVVQINVLVDSTLAFAVGPGANSSLWYGTRVMQFPLGVFAIAMGTALLPMISQQAAQKDREGCLHSLSFSLRSVFWIIIPSTVGLIVLSRPIMRLLFERGEFDHASTVRTAWVLVCYSIGLFAFSGQKIITTGFYAAQDTRTPVRIGVFALVSNIVLNLILMGPMREAGLAMATSLAGILQFLLLMFIYHRRIAAMDVRHLAVSFVKITAASLLMGGVCYIVYRVSGRFFSGDTTGILAIRVLGTILISMLVYCFSSPLLRIRELREVFFWVTHRGVPGE